jgi:signal transduction histidine kinase
VPSPTPYAECLLASLRTGLLAVDAAGRIEAVSPEALRILDRGGDPDPWRSEPVEELLAGEPELLALVREAQSGRDQPSRAELGLRSRDRTIGFTLIPVREDEGPPRGAALLFRDLTPFERADEQARLHDRLAALGQMASGLAHEIRNPLAAMEVLAGLLERRLQDAEAKELLAELVTEQRRIGDSVDACLEFVRPAHLERRPVDLAGLLREACEQARRRVPFEGVVAVSEHGPLHWQVDEGQLRRALVDLIVNALQAMNEAGSVQPRLELSASSAADGVLLVARDNGPGLPAELHERVFHPFFTTRERGSGVGLACVHKVIASHGGSISLESAPGQGAEFRIHLPPEPELRVESPLRPEPSS